MTQSSFQTFLKQGLHFHEQGVYNKALEFYQEAYRINPHSSKVNYLLGTLAFQGKNYQLAEGLFHSAIKYEKNGETATYYKQLGLLHLAKNEPTAAIENYHKALQNDQDPASTYCQIGSTYLRLESWDEAMNCFQKALEHDSLQTQAYNNIGFIYQRKSDYIKSNHFLEKALSILPSFHPLLNLGKNAFKLGLNDAALKYFQDAYQHIEGSQVRLTDLAIITRDAGFHEYAAQLFCELGVLLHRLNQHDTAKVAFQTACTLAPENPQYYTNLATFFTDIGELGAAESTFLKSFSIDNDRFDTTFNYSRFLKRNGKIDEALDHLFSIREENSINQHIVDGAIADLKRSKGDFIGSIDFYDSAIKSAPEISTYRYERALAYLTIGIFDKGWKDYTARVEEELNAPYIMNPLKENETMPYPEPYSIEDVKNKHFLFLQEQGLSNQLFFARFAPPLIEAGAEVSLYCNDKLEGILERTGVFHTVFSSPGLNNENIPETITEIYAIGDLPLICGHKEATNAPRPLTLKPLAPRVDNAVKRLQKIGNGPYLGITWRAGSEKEGVGEESLFKSIDLTELAKVIESWPGQVIILQQNPREEEIQALSEKARLKLHDFSEINEDLEDAIAFLQVLDDYIAVSNANVHIRTSLDKPCKVLLPFPGDWRWGNSNSKSCWFPTAKVYRQSGDLSWNEAIDQVTQDLQQQLL